MSSKEIIDQFKSGKITPEEFGDAMSDDLTEFPNPDIPEGLLSGLVARKFVFGRTDIGDYRNKIKNVHGNPIGTTVHVKRIDGQNVLTIEDVAGECSTINIVTARKNAVTVTVVKLPSSSSEDAASRKIEV